MSFLVLTGYFLSGAVAGGFLQYCSETPKRPVWFCLLTGSLFLFAGLRYPFSVQMVLILIFLLGISFEAYIDYLYMVIPDEILCVLLLAGLSQVAIGSKEFFDVIFGAIIGAVFLGAIFVLSKGGLGLGDVKFAGTLGLWLGTSGILVCLASAFVSGGIIAVGLYLSGKASGQTKIPFGPFLSLGAFASFFFSSRILSWYWSLLI